MYRVDGKKTVVLYAQIYKSARQSAPYITNMFRYNTRKIICRTFEMATRADNYDNIWQDFIRARRHSCFTPTRKQGEWTKWIRKFIKSCKFTCRRHSHHHANHRRYDNSRVRHIKSVIAISGTFFRIDADNQRFHLRCRTTTEIESKLRISVPLQC